MAQPLVIVIISTRIDIVRLTHHHRSHSLGHAPILKFKVGVFVPYSFKIEKRSSKPFAKEHQSTAMCNTSTPGIVFGRLRKNESSRRGLVCVLHCHRTWCTGWTRRVRGEVQEDRNGARWRSKGSISNQSYNTGIFGYRFRNRINQTRIVN